MNVPEKTWIDYASAIGSIATPLLVLAFSGIGWKLKKSIDKKAELEEKLRNDRIDAYNTVLEPIIIFLSPDATRLTDKGHKVASKFDLGTAKMHSLEYRKASFKLSLVANDSVVLAYCELMQFLFNQPDNPDPNKENTKQMFILLGNFLLEIRKSMGNEYTKLTNWQMLEWFLTDSRKVQNV